ncbi:MAG: AAA family ATPase, partial [Sediminibacterium sp.]|nr:AAA family ATPase [Sediminibacterium sp.]
MGIQLKQMRVHGFRGLDNLEIDFEPTTVIVGTNNAGKTTLLKSLQLCFSNTLQITDDDFYLTDEIKRDRIIIDILFISIDENGTQIE